MRENTLIFRAFCDRWSTHGCSAGTRILAAGGSESSALHLSYPFQMRRSDPP
jgi:hypothetical protein